MTLYFENEWTDEDLSETFPDFDPQQTAKEVFNAAMEMTDCPYEAQVNLLLTDENSIQEMNRSFRNIDRVTDVLSFPMLPFENPGDFSFLEEDGTDEDLESDCFDPESGELLLGDIVICVPRCLEQAKSYGHSVRREYAFLIAHSLLHLCGYDHMNETQEKEMFSLQEKILESLAITR